MPFDVEVVVDVDDWVGVVVDLTGWVDVGGTVVALADCVGVACATVGGATWVAVGNVVGIEHAASKPSAMRQRVDRRIFFIVTSLSTIIFAPQDNRQVNEMQICCKKSVCSDLVCIIVDRKQKTE